MEISQQLIERLENSPEMRQLRKREEAENLARRENLAEQLAQAEKTRQLPELRQAVEAAEAEFKAADQARTAALEKYRAAKAAQATEEGNRGREVATIKAELVETAAPAIDEAIDFFRDEHERLRHTSITDSTHQAGVDLVNMKRRLKTFSNHGSIATAMLYCRQAVERLEEMKKRPECDSEAIGLLKAAIPDPTEMLEYAGERSLEGGRPVRELDLLPSDDWLEAQHADLDKRMKKILK